jgi:hypothetical protein
MRGCARTLVPKSRRRDRPTGDPAGDERLAKWEGVTGFGKQSEAPFELCADGPCTKATFRYAFRSIQNRTGVSGT